MKNFTINGAWYHMDERSITLDRVMTIRDIKTPCTAKVQYPNGLTNQLVRGRALPLVDGLRVTVTMGE